MSEVRRNSIGSNEQCKARPDFFSFYACQIADLLSEDENTLSVSDASELSPGKYGVVNCEEESTDCSREVSGSLFVNSIGAGVSDFKKRRLKGLLRRSVNDLSVEVDEMLDPVVAISELRYKLRSKSLVTSALDGDKAQVSKKPKLSSSCSPTGITENSRPIKSGSCKEEQDDLEFLLKNNNQLLVEETVKKYSDELSSTLGHMEKKLEETLDTIMAKCRYGFVPEEGARIMPMSHTEKQQLQKLIRNLPNENLVRVVEIIRRGRPAESPCGEEIFVDLEKEENVTLWRLYYYVEAVEKAKMLARLQCSSTPSL